MRNFTTEQLEQVRNLAQRLVHPALIATAIGLDELEFKVLIKDPESELHSAYYDGFIQSKVELNEAVIKSAKNGSNPAQMEMKKLIIESENYFDY